MDAQETADRPGEGGHVLQQPDEQHPPGQHGVVPPAAELTDCAAMPFQPAPPLRPRPRELAAQPRTIGSTRFRACPNVPLRLR